MLRFRAACRASQGARAYQEDTASYWPGGGPLSPDCEPAGGTALVAVLADGMGGHAAGDVASTVICSTFLQSMSESAGKAAERLMDSLLAANDAIRAKASANPRLSGMGATLVGVHFGAQGCEWVSVGDSPMWLLRNGEMIRLNEDHSYAPLLDRMVEDGRMDADAARGDPRRHYLRSAVTGDDIDLVDASRRPLQLIAGDIVLLASDGILTLPDDEIRRTVEAYSHEGPEAAAQALVRAVDDADEPHQDNTTVVLVACLAALD